MALSKIFIILGALLTILGTYVFAVFGFTATVVGSGFGFAMNLPSIIGADPGADAVVFYIMLVVFIGWLASGLFQLVGLKSRIVGLIFSLFPLAVGLMFVLFIYTDILGWMTFVFMLFTSGELIGGFYPILVDLGTLGLGTYFLIGGGALGLIGCLMPQD
jgi:hypothetical protein